MLSVFKKKVGGLACAMTQLCLRALDVCENKGLLTLKYNGYALAYSLQNPYINQVPKLGISVRVSNISYIIYII